MHKQSRGGANRKQNIRLGKSAKQTRRIFALPAKHSHGYGGPDKPPHTPSNCNRHHACAMIDPLVGLKVLLTHHIYRTAWHGMIGCCPPF